MILHIKIEEAESIVTLPGVIGNVEVITVHFINLGILSWDSTSCYGDLLYVDKDNTDKVIRYWKSSPYKQGSFKYGWHPPHPTFFVKKEIYKKYGGFDTDFEVSADFELMLRFLEKYQISTIYLPEPIIKMRMGGESNKSIKNIIKGNINCYKAFKKNGLEVSIFYSFYRLIPKLKQFFRAPFKGQSY
jgi:hypothetical protein